MSHYHQEQQLLGLCHSKSCNIINNHANNNNDTTTEVLGAPAPTPCSQRAVILIPDTPQVMMAREVIDLTDSPF